MRLVGTFQDKQQAVVLSNYLNSKSIGHELEVLTNSDWGSADYGNATYYIWVREEDQLEQALNIVRDYQKNPNDPQFHAAETPLNYIVEPLQKAQRSAVSQWKQRVPPSGRIRTREPLGRMTAYVLALCCILFFWSELTAPVLVVEKDHVEHFLIVPGLPLVPQYYAPLKKELLFDYPQAYDIVDTLIKLFGIEKLQNLNDLPKDGQILLEQFYITPYWTGIYDKIIARLRDPSIPWSFSAPLFEKISQGQFWRLFTPAFLHYNMLHLLFNMIGLVVIGKQLEQRMGKGRYFCFILLTAAITNVAQYLMSGSNFLGFSGVLCAMVSFVWVRQKHYTWEGYTLHPSAFGFIAFFIVTLLLLQMASFITEISYGLPLASHIANTAHLVGLLAGALLGRMNFFSWNR